MSESDSLFKSFEQTEFSKAERNRVGNIVTMKLSEIKKFADVSFPEDKGFLKKFFDFFGRSGE